MCLICSFGLAVGFTQGFFLIFFYMFLSYRQVSISYIFLMCLAFLNIFYGVDLFSDLFLYLSFKHEFFRMNLYFIYLNKKI